jgi:hypothetical protein
VVPWRVGVSVSETERSIAICSHAIEQRDIFIVPMRRHDLFGDNVRRQRSRHLLLRGGAARDAEGHALGTLAFSIACRGR